MEGKNAEMRATKVWRENKTQNDRKNELLMLFFPSRAGLATEKYGCHD